MTEMIVNWLMDDKGAKQAQALQEYADRLRNAEHGDAVWLPNGCTASQLAAVEEAVQREKESHGNKHDGGKLPLHLLPVDALEAITEILDFGAKKYAPRNWEKGLDWSRVYRAALGHLFKWWANAGPDEETGKSHLWHAGCCILFLIAYELRSVGKDDRPHNSV